MLIYEPPGSPHVSHVVREMFRIARCTGEFVNCDFNHVKLVADPKGDPDKALECYRVAMGIPLPDKKQEEISNLKSLLRDWLAYRNHTNDRRCYGCAGRTSLGKHEEWCIVGKTEEAIGKGD